ncbi:hypothetical protein HBH47_056730 [Parastagonospora nodorum]|nr:hypothetical protein HBH51_057540 [Parastagonospora nodorum]KAH3980072.1 hypothetical protein HBH52_093680 [Parastagonospora nodorum]KAH4049600.1 hypothetical protein HBH49_134940 [Parastagonospora nodorum]KAH4125870.1 hypothetical protein HBH47_056730 [Parastagonospora nodorum]KAH4201243.1 hypothetical protein HBH42_026850 [Parastagonospora nodorum]
MRLMCIYAKEFTFRYADMKFVAYAPSFMLFNLGFVGQAKSDTKACLCHPVPEFRYTVDGRFGLHIFATTKDQPARVCDMLMSSATLPNTIYPG